MSSHAASPANRLTRETSPYLLQHAHNPVDWYPWGDAAFAEARRRNVPVFLSIGYSTCYWCHVMEREVFENEPIARLMNERFVNVKVDREERPDVDDIYMAATQLLTGRGGWPMSVFLEPQDLRPFWAGTYLPPEPRMGMPGFPQVIEALSKAWNERREEVVEQAASVAEGVRQHVALADAPVALSLEQVSEAARSLLRMHDRVHGGFGAAPKFPQPVFLELLLDVRERAGDEATISALDAAVRLTLDRIALGGLYDHVGGGFHRYSVDEKWLVPHFEKMLYDNAQLGNLYARAAAVYRDDLYRDVARRTFAYIAAEMTSPEGVFYSAQDAEVDGREGANYVWTPEQIRAALAADDAELALNVYGVNEGPNFRDPHHPGEPPTNVLCLRDRPERLAAARGTPVSDLLARITRVNRSLYSARSKRPQPRLDDKIITSWNGLTIAALARASLWLQEPEYARSAARAADRLLALMRAPDGRLHRTARGGAAGTDAFLEDYAFLIDGLLALEAAASKYLPDRAGAFLHTARELIVATGELFSDPATGAYFDARADQSDLFVRPRSTHDGATPSGSSAMLLNLIACCDRSAADPALERALACLRSLSAAIARSPLSTANATRGLLHLLTEDQAVADRIAAFGPAPAPTAGEQAEFTPVEIYADTERIELGREHPAQFKLVLRIAEGYHITAADPGHETGLIPLRVGITGGAGVSVYADYPPGEPYGEDGGLRVYRDQAEFMVAVERTGEVSGTPIITAAFQACTDTECLPPMTAELDVAIDVID
jgi:uncharacterized protein YyaL (SSP411 family)